MNNFSPQTPSVTSVTNIRYGYALFFFEKSVFVKHPNVEVEIEITKVGAKVFLRIKFMPFEKAAVMGFDLMPGSVDEEHVEII